jgi:uncharacterized protein (TIGR03437 family)
MMPLRWQFVFAAALACQVAFGQPTVGAVVNGASFEPRISPGSLISIYGTQLASETAIASSLPLPKALASTTVSIDGVAIPLYFVSSTQINAQVPFGTPGSSLVVQTAAGSSTPYTLSLTATAPAIFSRTQDGKGQALAFDGSFQELSTIGTDPFILYATGLGETDPPATEGEAGASVEPLQRVVNVPTIYIGEMAATVDYAGLAPGFAGVYQINVRPPAGALSKRIYLKSDGLSSNYLEVPLPGGTVQPASAVITPLYPTDGMTNPVTYSPVLMAAQVNLRWTLPADGKSHTIAAVAEDASLLIAFDASGHYEASLTTPTAMARMGNFYGSGVSVIDFMCQPTACEMPGDIVPASRQDPAAAQAIQSLPYPNAMPANGPNGLYLTAGNVSPGSLFVIDNANHSELQVFAAYVVHPYPVRPQRTTSFQLYIDATLVDSKDSQYKEGIR